MTAEDPVARTLITEDELREGVERLAGELSSAHPDGLVLVAVLKGSLIFLADLARRLDVPCIVDFLAISSYAPGTGRVRLVKDLEVDLTDRSVVLVEDVVDTGLTLAYLLGELGRRGPASLEVCTLLDKPARRIVPVGLDYVGFEVPDEFVIGYGLDYAGRYRNLRLVAAGDVDVLAEDPDAYLGQLYG
jgi:hypoxanthine phosphoribosyltransferase